MRALIIGCGYVGKALGLELAHQGHHVVGLRRTPADDADLKQAGIELMHADITDRASLPALEHGFDWVVNCAAAGGGGAEVYHRLYVQGNRNVLAWLRELRPKRFVYTSSTSVYGQDDGSWVTESSPTEPLGDTGQALVGAEQELLVAHRTWGFPSIVCRLSGIYGPGRGYWFKQFVAGDARLEGRGDRVLNMVHRDDVVGAVIHVLDRGRPGEMYNVTDSEPVSLREFLSWLSARLRRPMPPAGPDDAVKKRGSSNKRVSNQKLREILGYRLRYPSYREGYEEEVRRVLSAGG